ncbi:alanine--tRNA ligase-related protein, partial [Mycobacteroides abscessus subsp. massiliense]|uniref:alanine--tRNA ligase-related protein n=1 Tax=Mycobacteroides abscessus TaxID=36809 RepID=UPI003CF383B6
KFLGYETMETSAKVLAIVKDGERVESATAGDDAVVVLDQTSFYGESGGQVGDTGSIESDDAVLAVTNTTKNHAKNYLHHVSVTAGAIHIGETV